MAMDFSVLSVECFRTSLKEPVAYQLSPIDAILDHRVSTRRAVFLRSHLDWNKLCCALRKIEAVYRPLCGRYLLKTDREISVDPNGANGFGAVEIKASTTLAGIRSSKKLVMGCQQIDTHLNWPLFLERNTGDQVLNDTDSLFGVHLIHAKDGCVLSFAFRHLVCDGLRMAELMVDVSRAYRGLEIAERHLDRSILWPDRYLSRFRVLDHSPESYPSRFPTHQNPSAAATSELHLAQIHVPQATIDKMKAVTKGRLRGVDFVSTNDLVVALGWMLRAELRSKPHPVTAASLAIQGTHARLPMETGTSCLPVVPQNYFGNSLVFLGCKYPETDTPADSFLDILSLAASQVRRAVHEGQTKPEAVVSKLVAMYAALYAKPLDLLKNCICLMSTQAKMPFDKIDFGHRGQMYVFIPSSLPCFEFQSGVEVNTNGDGVLVFMTLKQADRNILEASRVLAECAPGAELLPQQMSEAEATKIMRL